MTIGCGQELMDCTTLGMTGHMICTPFCAIWKSRKGAYFPKWLNRRVCSCCMPSDNPDYKYHPKLQRFSEIHGVNTECAKQSFVWLKRLKLSMKQMQQNAAAHIQLLHTITNMCSMHIEHLEKRSSYVNMWYYADRSFIKSR